MSMKKAACFLLLIVIGMYAVLMAGCGEKEKSLIVYSGQGLKKPMEEIKKEFEQRHQTGITLIYAGSNTLLETIRKTTKGDVFIPGSYSYIKMAGEFVADSQYVASHIPAFIARSENTGGIKAYDDLLLPGVRIAAGNKDMCAIGKIAQEIIVSSGKQNQFAKNITITGSTVNELLDLVLLHEVDAVLAWADMVQWPEAAGLKLIEIPSAINEKKEIHVAVLTTTEDMKRAELFADFVASEGMAIFIKHGFGER